MYCNVLNCAYRWFTKQSASNYSFLMPCSLLYRLKYLKELRRHKFLSEIPVSVMSVVHPDSVRRLHCAVKTSHPMHLRCPNTLNKCSRTEREPVPLPLKALVRPYTGVINIEEALSGNTLQCPVVHYLDVLWPYAPGISYVSDAAKKQKTGRIEFPQPKNTF